MKLNQVIHMMDMNGNVQQPEYAYANGLGRDIPRNHGGKRRGANAKNQRKRVASDQAQVVGYAMNTHRHDRPLLKLPRAVVTNLPQIFQRSGTKSMTNSTSFHHAQMSPRFPLPKHGPSGIGSTDATRIRWPAHQADYVKEYEEAELVDNLEPGHLNWAGGPASNFDRSREVGWQGSVYNSM